MDDLLQEFLSEIETRARAFERDRLRLDRSPGDLAALAQLFTLFHTIRGTCRFLDLPRLEALASAAERRVGAIRDGTLPATGPALSPALDALDRIRTLLATLKETGKEPPGTDAPILASLASDAPVAVPPDPQTPPARMTASAPPADERAVAVLPQPAMPDGIGALADRVAQLVLARNRLAHLLSRPYRPEIAAALEHLSLATGALRRDVAPLRAVPFGACWPQLVEAASERAARLGRAVDFRLDGADVVVERALMEVLRDPVLRVMTHAVDKAIEDAATRRAAGKPERASIHVTVHRDGGGLTVAIADDGAGRGLGRDVDTSSLAAIGGGRNVSALRGQGTTVRLRVPLLRTVEPVLVLGCDGHRFVLPQAHVQERVVPSSIAGAGVERVRDTALLCLQDRRFPLLWLNRLADDAAAVADMPPVVALVRAGAAVFALAADAVIDAQDVVVTPLPPLLQGSGFLAGATILGDGGTALVLDVAGLAAALPAGADAAACAPREAGGDAAPASVDLLRFHAGEAAAMAIPVEALIRLEEVDLSRVDYRDGKPMLRSPQGPVPLLSLDGPPRIEEGLRPVLILSEADGSVGLVVDKVVDILRGHVEPETGGRPGLLGCAMLAGRRTEIVDPGYLARSLSGLPEGQAAASSAGSRST